MLDNASTHKTPQIKRWLQQHPRFHLHFTPTYQQLDQPCRAMVRRSSPTKLLRRGAHKSVRRLNAEIRNWIDTWNNDPKPYVWTKTADQILDSIRRYCERINAAGH